MATIVFIVHGMGRHPRQWSVPIRQRLNELAAQYDAFTGGAPLDERVELVEVSYDGVFAPLAQQFGTDFSKLKKFAQLAGVSLGKLETWLPTAEETEKEFFWNSALDVLLYFGFKLVRDEVRVRVMQQIATRLATAMDGGRIVNAFVIAHSLGTGVTSDSLALLGTREFNGSDAFVAGRGVKFKGIFTLANVSKEVQTDVDSYASVLHPDSATLNPASAAYCARYASFRHVLDPFCWLAPFDPPNWGSDFKNVDDLTHLRGFNVHGFTHYLDHPRVHIPIINGIFERPIITAQERTDAINDYPLLPSDCVPQFRELLGFVDGLSKPRDVEELTITGAKFLAGAKRLREACRALAPAFVVD
jgi:hypothetical protein